MVQVNDAQLLIRKAIEKAQKNEVFYQKIYESKSLQSFKNEFLFFIKPEITLPSENIGLDSILELVFEKISQYNLHINNIKILSADYLKKYDVIAQHYGVINKLANDPVNSMSINAKDNFESIFEVPLNECDIIGGFQFLNRYKEFTPFSLDVMWQNKGVKKLAGGTYCQKVKVDADSIYLVNGFHPRQLNHFTQTGRSIVVFTIAGDLDWEIARQEFIGATNPLKAPKGSIRRDLYEKKEVFGLPEVSQGLNGVHLSAGPIEGLVELVRYNSNFTESSTSVPYKIFSFGKKLAKHFSEEAINRILSNENVEVESKTISTFDLTEEKNSDEALQLLIKHFPHE